MDQLGADASSCGRPVKVLQYGEGNFLRAFVDYMLDIANDKTDFDGSVVIVKPIALGSLDAFRRQNHQYTVVLRGMENGERVERARVIRCVRDAVDSYTEYDRYLSYARCDTLRFVVSNTTESGIVLDESDEITLCPPRTFPGKLTQFLYERAKHFRYAADKGLILLPVELIDDNGFQLKRCVLSLARSWKLGEAFEKWLEESCVFTSTLVDRIVTGFPREDAEQIWEKLGFRDELLDTAEPFGAWVIESERDISAELPLAECGLPVIFTQNLKPYKQRKVRILNGAHTSFVPAAFCAGYDYVIEAMRDPLFAGFVNHTLHEEIIPTLDLPEDDLLSFASAVSERFLNPFIKHSLLAICLNSVSKWRARCLPSLLIYSKKFGKLPRRLTFSLAALLFLYHGGVKSEGRLLCELDGRRYALQDDEAVLDFIDGNRYTPPEKLVSEWIAREDFFGNELKTVPELLETVTKDYEALLAYGVRKTLQERI